MTPDDTITAAARILAELFPPNPIKHGLHIRNERRAQGQEPKKHVATLDEMPVTLDLISKHLTGELEYTSPRGHTRPALALGYLPAILDGELEVTTAGVIDIDWKDYQAREDPLGDLEADMTRLKNAAAALGLVVYLERSSRGKGWHVWLFAAEPIPIRLMRAALEGIVAGADLTIGKTETYPMGDTADGRWVITPYACALQHLTSPEAAKRAGVTPGLGRTYLETVDGQPIELLDAPDMIERNRARDLIGIAEEYLANQPSTQRTATITAQEQAALPGEYLEPLMNGLLTPPSSFERHASAKAVMNLFERAGKAQDGYNFVRSQELYDAWGISDSRTLEEWREEIDRWAAKTDGNRAGIPYLTGQGFNLPDIKEAEKNAAQDAYAAAKATALAAPKGEQAAALEAAISALATSQPGAITLDAELASLKESTGVTLATLRAAYQEASNPESEAGGERKSTATELIEQALARYDLHISEAGEGFAVPKARPCIPHLLRGGQASLRAQLAREYFEENQRAAPQQALADAMATLEGFAQAAAPTALHQRVAEHEGTHWLDLGDNTGQAVCITREGWTVEPTPPVYFRRTPLTAPLPIPERGSSIEELWEWLHVTEEDRPLVLAWLVALFWCDIPHPILGLFGEHGSGKTTVLKIIVLLIDSSPVPYRKPPRDADSWITAAAGSWVVGLDNLSAVSGWLSDTLCRAVTGEGDVRRQLYTDSSLVTFSFRRCLAMTSIDLGSLAGDLAERLLHITLDVIPEEERRDETSMWADWSAAHPRLLGALLDLTAEVARALPSVDAPRLPRMADYARILAAVDQLHGTNGLERYRGSQGRLALDTLSGDPFITAITETLTEPWEGTAAQLLERLDAPDEVRRSKRWPDNARAVTQRLRRQAPVMRKTGWHVSDDRGRNKAGVTRWSISPPEPEDPSEDTQTRDSEKKPRLTRQARHAVQDAENQAGNQQQGESAITRLTRHDPPLEEKPRQDKPVQDGPAGKAGKAGKENGEALADGGEALAKRAQALVARLTTLPLEALREQYADAAARANHPTWWAGTATTEPVEVTAALLMLATDQETGAYTGNPLAYLNAARGNHQASRREPPPGAPL